VSRLRVESRIVAVVESALAGLVLVVPLNLVLALWHMPDLLKVRTGIAVHHTFPVHDLVLNSKPERVIVGSTSGVVLKRIRYNLPLWMECWWGAAGPGTYGEY
jgi:hypothetical protein